MYQSSSSFCFRRITLCILSIQIQIICFEWNPRKHMYVFYSFEWLYHHAGGELGLWIKTRGLIACLCVCDIWSGGTQLLDCLNTNIHTDTIETNKCRDIMSCVVNIADADKTLSRKKRKEKERCPGLGLSNKGFHLLYFLDESLYPSMSCYPYLQTRFRETSLFFRWHSREKAESF